MKRIPSLSPGFNLLKGVTLTTPGRGASALPSCTICSSLQPRPGILMVELRRWRMCWKAHSWEGLGLNTHLSDLKLIPQKKIMPTTCGLHQLQFLIVICTQVVQQTSSRGHWVKDLSVVSLQFPCKCVIIPTKKLRDDLSHLFICLSKTMHIGFRGDLKKGKSTSHPGNLRMLPYLEKACLQMQLRILRYRSFWIIRLRPKSSDTEGWHTEKRSHEKQRERDGSDAATSQGLLEPPGAGRGRREPPLEPGPATP